MKKRKPKGPSRQADPWVVACDEYARDKPDYRKAMEEFARVHAHEHVDCRWGGCLHCSGHSAGEKP